MADMVTVEGLDDLARTLRRAMTEIEDMADASRDTAELVAGTARAAAPRRTGRLAGSIRAETEPGIGAVGSPLVYAPPIHWGWRARRIQPNRFISDTFEALQPQWERFYQRDAQQALDKVRGA